MMLLTFAQLICYVYRVFLRVEVDTVDGFQGREMDCVIVSCVRASSDAGSIG